MAGPPGDAASPGRQAVVLVGGVVVGFLAGMALGAPFGIDVGGGHAVFHAVVALVLGLSALWLRRHGTSAFPSRLATWSAAALAFAQLVEGLVAIPDAPGDSAAHEIPNAISLAVLQPAVLVAICWLAVLHLRPVSKVGGDGPADRRGVQADPGRPHDGPHPG